MAPDINDPGLLTPAGTCLLTDQYELAMAASYVRRGMNEPSIFELFARHLPPHRDWLLTAGLGQALALVEALRFGADGWITYRRLASSGRCWTTCGHSDSSATSTRCPRARWHSRASPSSG